MLVSLSCLLCVKSSFWRLEVGEEDILRAKRRELILQTNWPGRLAKRGSEGGGFTVSNVNQFLNFYCSRPMFQYILRRGQAPKRSL